MNTKTMFFLVLLAVGGYVFLKGVGLFTQYQGCDVKEGLSVIPLVGYYKCEMLGETCETVDIPDSGNPLDEFTSCCDVYATTCSYVLEYTNGDLIKNLGTFNRGTCVTVKKDNWVFTGQRQLRRCFHPYTLYNYDPSGGRSRVFVSSEYSCTVPNSADLLLSTVLPFFKGQSSTSSVGTRTLDFDESSNYVSGWAVAPVESNFVNHPTHGQVFCSGDGQLYSVTSVKLSSGCYAIPNLNDAFKKEDCCPGAISASCTCNSNFKWDCVTPPECDLLKPCPGSGYYTPDYSDINRKTAVKYSCDNGKCIAKKVTSDCATNEACSTGMLCMLDPNTGIGTCVSSGTPPQYPRPPGTVPAETEISWFAVVAALLAFLIFGGKDLKRRNIVGMVTAVVAAVVVYMVVGFIMSNYVAIAATLGLVAIFGGLAMYFFGGTIIMVLLLLIRLVKK